MPGYKKSTAKAVLLSDSQKLLYGRIELFCHPEHTIVKITGDGIEQKDKNACYKKDRRAQTYKQAYSQKCAIRLGRGSPVSKRRNIPEKLED